MYKLVIAALLITLSISCKKESDENCIIKSKTDSNGNVIIYEIQNNKIVATKLGPTRIEYSYSNGTLINIKQYYNGQLYGTDQYTTMSDGNVSQITSTSSNSPNANSIFSYRNGVLYKETSNSSNGKEYYYYTFDNDQLVERKYYTDDNGQEELQNTMYYTYGNEPNPFYGMYPKSFFVENAQNLVSNIRSVSAFGYESRTDYTYVFDNKGLLREIIWINGNRTYNSSYDYYCR